MHLRKISHGLSQAVGSAGLDNHPQNSYIEKFFIINHLTSTISECIFDSFLILHQNLIFSVLQTS